MGAIIFSQGHLAELAFACGDAEEAQAQIEDILERFPYDTASIAAYRLRNILGDIARSRGQLEQAEEQYRHALRAARHMRNIPVMLESLAGLAVSSPAAGSGRAVELLTFVLQHPASDFAIRRRSRQLLDQEMARLSPDEFQAAEAGGRALTLESALERIIAVPSKAK